MRSPDFDTVQSLVPKGSVIDWQSIWSLWPELSALDSCPQDPVFHAEGDVGIHTRMVVEALIAEAKWQAMDDQTRGLLFWTAVLHDIGKPAVTKTEPDGRITSRGHSRVGAAIARQLLWEAEAPFEWRETLCGLILAHQLPFWLLDRPDPRRLAIQTSWRCRADWLCLHATADARGRVCSDQIDILENVALSQEVFLESACLDKPFAFANDESRLAWFEREDRDPYFAAHEDFRCTVTMMAALPGSGKDTWIANNGPDDPVVSLDMIRDEIGAKPTGNQGKVVQLAQERARQYLRAGQDFVWNGTNVTRQTRARVLRILRDYGARIRIVYIEPPRRQLLLQNRSRDQAVPEAVIAKLAGKLEPPEWNEAHEIKFCI